LAADDRADCCTDPSTEHVDVRATASWIPHGGGVADSGWVSDGLGLVYRRVVSRLWPFDVNGSVYVYRAIHIYGSFHHHFSLDVYRTLDDLPCGVTLLADAAMTVVVLTCPASVVRERRDRRSE
jgi:hypothetical protein